MLLDTGYAEARAERDGLGRARQAVKSVNHRFLDPRNCACRKVLICTPAAASERPRKNSSRHVEVTVSRGTGESRALAVNRELVQSYRRRLERAAFRRL